MQCPFLSLPRAVLQSAHPDTLPLTCAPGLPLALTLPFPFPPHTLVPVKVNLCLHGEPTGGLAID